MRYEEGPTAHAEVLVDAPLDRVWELVTDINLPARFSNEFRGATWIDDGPAMGVRFAGRNWHKAMGERRDPALRDADGVERAPRVYDTCGALDAVRRRTRATSPCTPTRQPASSTSSHACADAWVLQTREQPA